MRAATLLLALAVPAAAAAQTNGSIIGHVRQREGAVVIAGAQVGLDGRWLAVTDSAGAYRLREVRSGWHLVTVRAIGFETVQRDSVLVRAGQITLVNFTVDVYTIDRPIVIEAFADSILDPSLVATVQRIGGEELRRFPVTTLEEAVGLSAGAVGESYRGGRLGQQAFVLDGLGVKNQLDASTGPLGVRIPPDILTEASLVTNGFSARYGQALSGLINVVTKDGGDRWAGRAAYEGDRLLWGSADLGLDRAILSVDGPLGHDAGLVAVFDAEGRLDADPVNAPRPTDPRDPRNGNPMLLPHNSGERYDAAAKLRVPLGGPNTLRLFALRSAEQRLLYDPVYKYDARFAPARRVTGNLLSAHVQRATNNITADLRAGYFTREFIRGTAISEPTYRFGAVTASALRFVGEDVARAQDTLAAGAPIPGFNPPDFSDKTPWGVPAFFLGSGSNGEVSWNRYRELRAQLDVSIGRGTTTDFYVGAELSKQRVQTFQRVLGYLPAGDSVPPPTASAFSPTSAAAYAEVQGHGTDFVVTLGLRYDQVDPGAGVPGGGVGSARRSINPRFGFSTVLKGATVVVSYGRFSQAPDFQYLVDAAFDDTLRTGRFRRGNPNLGFEAATQYEFSVRARPSPRTNLRVNVFSKSLTGLVASVPLGLDPDSTIFGNLDYGTVKGAEVIFDRPLAAGWGVRVAYTLQQATATATDAFALLRRIRLGPTGDTIYPARVEFPLDYDRRHSLTAIGQGQLRGFEGAVIVRYSSGLPFSKTNETGDTLIGLPNSYRLPSLQTVDMLLRRPIRVGSWQGSVYVDVRNLLNRRSIEAVRRETGQPGLLDTTIVVLAEGAYQAHPEPIPYESPRYRAFADMDGNGLIQGHAELYPLYLAAARDYFQPLFAYGPPRMVRLGVELVF